MEDLKYKIAVSLIPGIGDISAKKLIAHCGGAEAIFKEKKAALLKIPGFGEKAVNSIRSAKVLERAGEEVEFIAKNNIQAHFYLDKNYPQRLLHCEDGPIMLYSKGNIDWNAQKMISFVGTRMATVKGRGICEKLIDELKVHQPTIVSGLAYGIDITAHQAALKSNLPTIGILGCGLDEIYPKVHAQTAEKMQKKGGIATDYMSKTTMLPINFAERNRIVAGLSDAVVVIESSAKGGSLITADLANGYNRDVFAVPGRIDDSQSVGCNRLIKTNKAALIESAKDLEYILGWEKVSEKKRKAAPQKQLFVELTAEEQQVIEAFNGAENMAVDELSLKASLPISKTTSILLNLEFKGVIRSLPGKMYQRI
ncbi:MAG: DNA-processing protein DprA [Vicingaceae bacterium]